ncbi:MAG: methionyl-tRNA formyltransferase [Firmicutes bacterium]|jgi:methionyl-tRNA formyltransferase|nr:methionyl-tRNA formyltransferase [Bacillota bacterium]MDH7495622.1 methionyl-tRNA formyltransferase [Bacillota bacterium]
MVVVFMGSPDFAVPSLRAVIEAGHSVACVVTQPDKARARGRRLAPTPVREFAESRGLRVLTPRTLKDENVLNSLREAAPDVIVVVAYGLLLPPEVLAIPKHGCVNVHASLLPKYRGAAPIERALMAGDRSTGVTTMYMAEGWDTGDVILQEEIEIGEDVTAGELRKELAERGARLLEKTLSLIESGRAPRMRQDEEDATCAPRVRPEEFEIDWSRPAHSIHNLVRAGNPKPGAFTRLHGAILKIFKGRPVRDTSGIPGLPSVCGPPGTVCARLSDGILVRTGEGFYLATEVQAEGGRRMPAPDYLRGHPVEPGTVLGG